MSQGVVRMAVSIPAEEYKKIEKARKTLRVTRSFFVTEAVRRYFSVESKKSQSLAYVEGYRLNPETDEETRLHGILSANVLASEEWS
ncbi:MAG: hypothetical protein WC889_08710 [Myxococcota bacterium]|jgi:metal-responsive CopG/Arc/MetJ family transcriptional regulator